MHFAVVSMLAEISEESSQSETVVEKDECLGNELQTVSSGFQDELNALASAITQISVDISQKLAGDVDQLKTSQEEQSVWLKQLNEQCSSFNRRLAKIQEAQDRITNKLNEHEQKIDALCKSVKNKTNESLQLMDKEINDFFEAAFGNGRKGGIFDWAFFKKSIKR